MHHVLFLLMKLVKPKKLFLEFNKNKIPSILLEHGFLDKNDSVSKVKRYDIMSNYSNFTDKIAVWSETKKLYLIDNYQIDPNRIIVSGSPRHDKYFSSRKNNNSKKRKNFTLSS